MEPAPASTLRKVSVSDIDTLVYILARAFIDDPLFLWLLPDRFQRQRALQRSFAVQIRHIYLPLGECTLTEEHNGGAMWAPPGRWKLSIGQQLQILPDFMHIFGMTRMQQLLRVFGQTEKLHAAEPPHWYLAGIGVDPAWQRQGVGSALLRPVLDLCDMDGLPAYLETANPRSLEFYAQHGFAVRHVVTVPNAPPVWLLRRQSHAPV